jgi:hypothetical protein
MIYAQFYHKSATSNELIEASGYRSVIILDGRFRLITHTEYLNEECKKRNYLAWRVFKGESFTRSQPVSDIKKIIE